MSSLHWYDAGGSTLRQLLMLPVWWAFALVWATIYFSALYGLVWLTGKGIDRWGSWAERREKRT